MDTKHMSALKDAKFQENKFHQCFISKHVKCTIRLVKNPVRICQNLPVHSTEVHFVRHTFRPEAKTKCESTDEHVFKKGWRLKKCTGSARYIYLTRYNLQHT